MFFPEETKHAMIQFKPGFRLGEYEQINTEECVGFQEWKSRREL